MRKENIECSKKEREREHNFYCHLSIPVVEKVFFPNGTRERERKKHLYDEVVQQKSRASRNSLAGITKQLQSGSLINGFLVCFCYFFFQPTRIYSRRVGNFIATTDRNSRELGHSHYHSTNNAHTVVVTNIRDLIKNQFQKIRATTYLTFENARIDQGCEKPVIVTTIAEPRDKKRVDKLLYFRRVV